MTIADAPRWPLWAIGCGYQLADQRSCEDLFVALVDSAQLKACNDCVVKEECATEKKVCSPLCTAHPK